jgi:glutathione S-transferase
VELTQPRIIVAESAAVGLYIAQKAGKLIPSDFHGRTRETQWCFAAMNSRAAALSDRVKPT